MRVGCRSSMVEKYSSPRHARHGRRNIRKAQYSGEQYSGSGVGRDMNAGGDNKAAIGLRMRRHIRAELYDDSGAGARGIAIYTLSDPRSIRDVRYVGQTQSPPRRFAQHLNTARLWLPDELPWWVESPKLRPLYTWIRELYADDRRMPVMVVTAWAGSPGEARVLERARIMECLESRLELLNVEREILGRQGQLI
jgi:hypothetical protein